LVIALVVLVLVTGLPVLMGMDGMASCESCTRGVLGGMVCLAILAGLASALASVVTSRVSPGRRPLRSSLLVHLLERPPQLATA
jgi:hypothetical protein